MTNTEKGLQVLAHDNLPTMFTHRNFHHVAFSIFECCECTSRKILSALKKSGYIEVERPNGNGKVAIYSEVRT